MRNIGFLVLTGIGLVGTVLCGVPVQAQGMNLRTPRRTRPQTARLSLEEARSYMVELINRDRASMGLRPVRLDLTATAAGQKHAEEMAENRYLAHWNFAGKLPDQRYSEAGGTHAVMENVYLSVRYQNNRMSDRLTLEPAPTFTRREIEDIESAYFNELPPNDGHRRNILDPEHTHVGISLARARSVENTFTLTNTQEFVNQYFTLDALPAQARVGERVRVQGKVNPDVSRRITFRSVSLGWAPLPKPRTRADLERTHSYSTPASFVSYWPEPYVSPRPVTLTSNGGFSVDVTLSDRSQPGLYYVAIWAKDAETGKTFVASQRTLVVE